MYIYTYTHIYSGCTVFIGTEKNKINITMIAATHHNPVYLAKDKESTTCPLNNCYLNKHSHWVA